MRRFWLLCLLVSLCQSAWADPIVVSASGSGRTLTVNVPPGTAPGEKVIVTLQSRRSVGAPIFVELEGPAGLRGNVQFRKLSGSVALAAVSKKGWSAVTMRPRLQVRGTAGLRRSTCAPEVLDLFRELIRTIPGWSHYTPEELCERQQNGEEGTEIPGGGGSGGGQEDPGLGSSGASVRSAGLLTKDSCARRAKYLVRVVFTLNRIDPALLAAGFNFNVTLTERNFSGRTAATIKPVSDGKFAPHPLLLMSSTGGYNRKNEVVYLVRWKGKKLRGFSTIPVEDYVYYRGLTLTRSVVGRFLTGGKGTFMIVNNSSFNAYSVCFNLTRTRQKTNGYPD